MSQPVTEEQPLHMGLRSSQVATGIVLVTLLAALGFAALRNAEARDRETAFLSRVEGATASFITAQSDALALADSLELLALDPASVAVSGNLVQLHTTLDAVVAEDPLAEVALTEEFLDVLGGVDSAIAAGVSPDTITLQDWRTVIVRSSRTWLTTYQSSAVATIKELSGTRADNERNQAILLMMSLALSVWLLGWIGHSMNQTYRRARTIINAEEAKVASARSALRHASDQLSYQATHDALTGLPNRIALMDRLSAAVSDPTLEPVAVFFCDLDRFKVVNDSLGHAIGDDLLVEAGNRFLRTVNEQDFVARFGGDEFVVVATNVADRTAAVRAAERLIRAMSKPFDVQGADAFIGMSVGIAISSSDSTASQLLSHADAAMYRAKSAGGHIEVYDTGGDPSPQRFDTENALRKAVSNRELLLHWQPIVNLRNGQVHTLEALVRWDRPGTGIIKPAEFMAIAEDTGLIVDIGRWVIAAACSAAALTDDRSVAVNVSARQLRDVRFVDDLREILAESGLPAERLILEVTEHTVIDADVVHPPLQRVRELGVRIALDDFGTGYSSLSLLHRLPVDIVKLDRSFLRDVTTSQPTQAIIKSLVQLTQALNKMLIVEGVESDAQRRQLRSLGVQHGQGYWFGQPEPGRLLRSRAAD